MEILQGKFAPGDRIKVVLTDAGENGGALAFQKA